MLQPAQPTEQAQPAQATDNAVIAQPATAALSTVPAQPAVPTEAIVIALPADATLHTVQALPAVATLLLVPTATAVTRLSLVDTDATVTRLERVSRLNIGSRSCSSSRGRFMARIIADVRRRAFRSVHARLIGADSSCTVVVPNVESYCFLATPPTNVTTPAGGDSDRSRATTSVRFDRPLRATITDVESAEPIAGVTVVLTFR